MSRTYDALRRTESEQEPKKDLTPWRIERLPDGSTEKEYGYSRERRAPNFPDTTATQELHLRDYWKMVLKRRLLVAGVFLTVLAFVAYVNFTATPLYTAKATLKIEPQVPKVTGVGEISTAQAPGANDYVETQFVLLKGRALAAKVIAELALESDPVFTSARVITSDPSARLRFWVFGSFMSIFSYVVNFIFLPKDDKPEEEIVQVREDVAQQQQEPRSEDSVDPRLVDKYLAFIKVAPVRGTRLVDVVFTTPDPKLSHNLANAHVAGFKKSDRENRLELTKEAREFLDMKNSELKSKLQRSEDALNRLRQAHGVVSLEKGENVAVDRFVELSAQLAKARAERVEAELLARTVKDKDFRNLSQVVKEGLVANLRGNLATLEAERARLATIFNPDHPRLLEIGEQITEARRALELEIAAIVRGIESNYAFARAKEDTIHAEAMKQQKMALQTKEIGVQYAVLQQEVNVDRVLYESVLKRLNETHVSNDLAVSNMTMTERARMPVSPSSPNISHNVLVGMGFGLFLGVGMAFFMEYLDSTIRTAEDVWRATSIPTLGVVPHVRSLRYLKFRYGRLAAHSPIRHLGHPGVPSNHTVSKELIVSHHPLSIISESYRSIRTALLLSDPPKVIMLTSGSPGDGKTVTTLNLGIALAQVGHSVLVIDADLRKGRCHTVLGLQNHKGITDILMERLPLENAIYETVVPGLSLLSKGGDAVNPPDLLCSQKLKEVMDVLRERFDFILVDCPPVIGLSDPAVLSKVCDAVVLVLNGQKTKVATVRRVTEQLEAVHARILGVVLNGVDIRHPDFADYRHNYRSYYAQVKEGPENTTGGDRQSL
jgi:succinoglycan biosynthesis transport protein ExoP